MKKVYESPELITVQFKSENVLTLSNETKAQQNGTIGLYGAGADGKGTAWGNLP